jgi:hypothetical protein
LPDEVDKLSRVNREVHILNDPMFVLSDCDVIELDERFSV